MVETKQLKIFKTIVDVGTFTGAGEQLGLSQSAISQQMRALEEALGVALLVRAGRGARPTPAGDRLYHCARQVLERLDDVERTFVAETDGRAGVIRIGAPEPPCGYVLPGALVALRRQLPNVELHVTSGHPAAMMARLAAGDVDLALLPLPIASDRLRVVEVGHDELVAIAPMEHRWVARGSAQAPDFHLEPIVLYDRRSAITEAMLGFLLEGGVFPTVAVEIDQLEAVKELVRGGLGVAVVPRWAVRREVAAGALGAVRLGDSGLRRTWGLVFPDGQPRPATVAAVVCLLSEELRGRFT